MCAAPECPSLSFSSKGVTTSITLLGGLPMKGQAMLDRLACEHSFSAFDTASNLIGLTCVIDIQVL